MKPLLLAAMLLLPSVAAAQHYDESLFAGGLDPSKSEPLTEREIFKTHLYRAIGSEALAFTAVSAGLNQWRDNPAGWGQGADGYGKRFASQAGTNAVRQMIGFGLDAKLHTDSRLYRSTRTHFAGRLYDAVSQVVLERNESGGRVLAIGNVGSAFAAGQIQTLWKPELQSHVGDGLVNTGIILLGDCARNVAREFMPDVMRKFHHEK